MAKWLESLWKSLTGSGLTPAQQEANQYSSDEARFARNWQEKMYLQYESPAAMMKQYQEAGLNPMLLADGYSPSGVGSAGSSPDSVSPQVPQLMGLLEFAGNMVNQTRLASAQVRDLNASADEKESAAERNRVESERTRMLSEAERDRILSEIDLNRVGVSRQQAATALDYANVGILQIDANTRDLLNRTLIAEREAATAKYGAETENARQQFRNLQREYVISFAREAEIKANTEKISKETLNTLVMNDILYWNSKSAQYQADIDEFKNDKKKADRVWDKVSIGFGILKDVGIGVGAVAAGVGKAVGSAVGSAARSARGYVDDFSPRYLNGD